MRENEMRLIINVVIGFSFVLFSTASFAGKAKNIPRKLSECLEAIEEGSILYQTSNSNYDKYRVIHNGSLYLYELDGSSIFCHEIVMDK